jgi:crossover junction endodeoxyribonuclease RuvC
MDLVLGIDPGSHFTGYGIVKEINGRLQCIAFGVLEANAKDPFAQRLLTIGEALAEIFRQYEPTAVALEKVFFAKNADSATKLGQVRGVCLYEAARAKVPIFEYNPTEVKSSIAGNGRAGKDQVQFVVQALLGLPTLRKFDMSDALALAIHHSRQAATKKKMRESEILT